MFSQITNILTSPATLYSTTLTSFLISQLISKHVKHHGPIPIFRPIIKYNSISYSLFSLCLFFCVFFSVICSLPTSFKDLVCERADDEFETFEGKLRLVYHTSKIYEYVDIFNVLANGGIVNTHFWVHHFTTPYLTYTRVILHLRGWKVFAALNTMHHAFMYAYFGGVTLFSGLLLWMGYAQLIIGILGEAVILWGGCGNVRVEGLWANWVGLGLLSTYAVLFFGDVVNRGKGEEGKAKKTD